MSYVADLHLHSPYAYATSRSLTLENLAHWAQLKGIDLLASADFTHPVWFRELREKLVEVAPGTYQYQGVHFILGTEVSCVYSQSGRQRRLHLLLFAPNFDTVARINQALAPHGNLFSDGRPTLRLSARDLTALVLEINSECIVIPAHVWTPWYGVYGSKSGFDTLQECFQDLMPHIQAVETGLSSDPAMNWGVPELADKCILSFSDAHSLPKLAREVTVFQGELSYSQFSQAVAQNQVAYTAEFYPEEGKYHYNGHRKCNVHQSPVETLREGSRCPVCNRPMTLGVLHQVSLLSGNTVEFVPDSDGFIHPPDGRPPFLRLVPLQELIAETLGQGVGTRRVQNEYQRLVQELGGELEILIRANSADLEQAAGRELARAILQARRGQVVVEPGYDGVFGKISVPPVALQGTLPGIEGD
ncbi:MAG: endonuclease Q family protein [Dehalococcoidia bacterium]